MSDIDGMAVERVDAAFANQSHQACILRKGKYQGLVFLHHVLIINRQSCHSTCRTFLRIRSKPVELSTATFGQGVNCDY
jgi:hypothetical protein